MKYALFNGKGKPGQLLLEKMSMRLSLVNVMLT